MNNYDKILLQSQKRFLTYDREDLLKNIGCNNDEEYFYYEFCGSPYCISSTNGQVQRLTPTGEKINANFHESMSLFDLFCSKKAGAAATGSWVTEPQLVKNVPSPSKNNNFFAAAEKIFDQNPAALDALLKTKRCHAFPVGDIAGVLPVFPCLSIVFQFWRGDEDFSPSLRFLWDAATLDFLHYETMFYIELHWVDLLQNSIKKEQYHGKTHLTDLSYD